MSPDAGSIPAASTILLCGTELIGFNKTTAKRLAFFFFLFSSFPPFSAAQPTLGASARDADGTSRAIITFPSSLPFTLEKDGNLLLVRINSTSRFRLRADPVESRLLKPFSWVQGSEFFIIILEARHEAFRFDSFQIEEKQQL